MTPFPDRPTTRSLLLGLVDADGRLDARAAHDVGAACGYSGDQIRLCLARLVAEELLVKSGRGKDAEFFATDRYRTLVEPELAWLALAFEQDAGRAPWSGTWCLTSFALDEAQRAGRNALREHLTLLGAAPLAPGTYVCAHEIGDFVRLTARTHGIEGSVSIGRVEQLEVGAARSPKATAAALWPLEQIAISYRAFTDRFRSAIRGRSRSSTDTIALTMAVTAAFEHCIASDPLLPPELLPARWPGRDARQLLAEGARRLAESEVDVSPTGFDRYQRLLSQPTGPRR